MKQQPWKRALSLMLAFALMFAMPCVTGVYAAGEPVDYIERWWDSRKQVVDSRADSVTVYTEIDPNTTTWNGGTTGGCMWSAAMWKLPAVSLSPEMCT